MKLTQQDKARLLNITPMTLRNWRKNKPFLYEIIEKGFAFDDAVLKTQKNAEELKELQNRFEFKKN
jgi:hypothetical protein